MHPAAYRFLLVLAATFALTACGRSNDAPATVDLTVMTFNIELGGTRVSFDNVVEAIRRSGADIVAVSEAEANSGRIAAEIGWRYDDRHYLVSRFPIIDPPEGGGLFAYVEVAPGRVVAVAHAHLPAEDYGPYLVRDGAGLDEVLAVERRVRLPKIRDYLDALVPLVEQGIPVFLAGDMNSPAHTDWTGAMVGARPQLRYAVRWPVSEAVVAAGLHDSWRTVYPDAAAHPGLTWWAGRPAIGIDDPPADDPQDRIDFVWFAGPATARSSILVGEAGGPEVSIGITPWVSDHRAVVSTFSVRPAPLPAVLTSDRRVYRTGDDITIFHAGMAGNLTVDQLDPDGTTVPVAVLPVLARSTVSVPAESLGRGRFALRQGDLAPRIIWIQPRGAVPSIDVLGHTFAAGQGISVRWRNGPGNRNDYIALVAPDEPPAYYAYASYAYIDAQPEGTLEIGAATAACCWPIPAGRYVARLIRDDADEVLAESAPFDVQ